MMLQRMIVLDEHQLTSTTHTKVLAFNDKDLVDGKKIIMISA